MGAEGLYRALPLRGLCKPVVGRMVLPNGAVTPTPTPHPTQQVVFMFFKTSCKSLCLKPDT